MTASATRLIPLVGPAVAAAGCVLEDLTVTPAGRRSIVRVLVDSDTGITLDEVADVSRAVGEVLDAADEADPGLFGASYVLEVSSPGVDRPLTAPRHWQRNTGRLVSVTLRGGSAVTGRVVDTDESGVTLDVDGEQRRLTFADLLRGVVQVEFSRRQEEDE